MWGLPAPRQGQITHISEKKIANTKKKEQRPPPTTPHLHENNAINDSPQSYFYIGKLSCCTDMNPPNPPTTFTSTAFKICRKNVCRYFGDTSMPTLKKNQLKKLCESISTDEDKLHANIYFLPEDHVDSNNTMILQVQGNAVLVDQLIALIDKHYKEFISRYNQIKLLEDPMSIEIEVLIQKARNKPLGIGFFEQQYTSYSKVRRFVLPPLVNSDTTTVCPISDQIDGVFTIPSKTRGEIHNVLGNVINKGIVLLELNRVQVRSKEEIIKIWTEQLFGGFIIAKFLINKDTDIRHVSLDRIVKNSSAIRRRDGKKYVGDYEFNLENNTWELTTRRSAGIKEGFTMSRKTKSVEAKERNYKDRFIKEKKATKATREKRENKVIRVERKKNPILKENKKSKSTSSEIKKKSTIQPKIPKKKTNPEIENNIIHSPAIPKKKPNSASITGGPLLNLLLQKGALDNKSSNSQASIQKNKKPDRPRSKNNNNNSFGPFEGPNHRANNHNTKPFNSTFPNNNNHRYNAPPQSHGHNPRTPPHYARNNSFSSSKSISHRNQANKRTRLDETKNNNAPPKKKVKLVSILRRGNSNSINNESNSNNRNTSNRVQFESEGRLEEFHFIENRHMIQQRENAERL